MSTRRAPAVAGRFYPGEPTRMASELSRYIGDASGARPARVLMGPHAGWIYSGAIAGEGWRAVEVPERVVVMCPNHTGLGVRRSIWGGGAWGLPGGDVAIDEDLRGRLVRCAGLTPDLDAHLREHAIEVHVPFARARQPRLRLTAICLSGLSAAECREIGLGIADALREVDDDVLLVASTDMSHYIPADEASVLDHHALQHVVDRDPDALYGTVRSERISMCGVIPTAVALHAANALGATSAELLRYGNSGEVSGDHDRVVGYATAVVR